ncbi:ABC transporter ATP-binding protein [Enterococcus alcedinis]|uniref:ABC transporter ATP-binding protein n=1 Tax=Enterococcus alcedinis TaxID=1274384 RepID=A0A917JD33_9ENTE|nr:ABC-F family ATP-binding cassette domain-containing protein [Enterococcus alcedinis]MBP2101185.1 ATP-binding cassette subfamily F protein uup [Enterococcus alcedinis]GGI64516.1 ABC transporter ATP-binding protein [Enterococcus alcedinis]
MKELKVTELSKTYGDKDIFNEISFLIHTHDRIGLIGVNGTGKTSLLSILSGKEKGDGDRQSVFYPRDYRVGYLSQATDLAEELTVLEAVFQGESEQLKAVKRYEAALMILEQDGENIEAQKEFQLAQDAMTEKDAWMTDTNAKIILQKLGIQELNKKIKELSGGQKKRVGLAQVLIDEPDLLLLDEPTNHLDYQTIEWLEDYLRQYRGSLVMVTHDRYFLDRVTNRIFELSYGQLHEYKGNYGTYLLEKSERDRVEGEQEEKRKQLYKQELSWMRAGAKARTTKQQARINRFEDLKDNLYQVKHSEDIEIDIATQRLGKKVFELKDASYKIGGKTILEHFDLLIQSRERLGITGANGAGKSTLLNLLAGRLELDTGMLSVGETVRLAYYTQENEAMDNDKRMIAYLQEAAEAVTRQDGTQMSVAELLERFLFPRHVHGTKLGKLSGGEKRRLYLLKLLVAQPNVLLLDEPTNDLDIDTLTILEDYLQSFPGAIITVSHDRYFLDKVAEKLLVFEGDAQIQPYFGSINDYLLEDRITETSQSEPVKVDADITPIQKEKKKLSYMEQREWETIEDKIGSLEEAIEQLTQEMNNQGSDFTKLQKIQQEITEKETMLEEKMNRWEYLSEWAD